MTVLEVEYPVLIESVTLDDVLLSPRLAMLNHVDVTLDVRLGQTTVTVEQLFSLKAGSLMTLDRHVDEPVELLLNNKVIAFGHLAVSGDQLGVRITDILNDDLTAAS